MKKKKNEKEETKMSTTTTWKELFASTNDVSFIPRASTKSLQSTFEGLKRYAQKHNYFKEIEDEIVSTRVIRVDRCRDMILRLHEQKKQLLTRADQDFTHFKRLPAFSFGVKRRGRMQPRMLYTLDGAFNLQRGLRMDELRIILARATIIMIPLYLFLAIDNSKELFGVESIGEMEAIVRLRIMESFNRVSRQLQAQCNEKMNRQEKQELKSFVSGIIKKD